MHILLASVLPDERATVCATGLDCLHTEDKAGTHPVSAPMTYMWRLSDSVPETVARGDVSK